MGSDEVEAMVEFSWKANSQSSELLFLCINNAGVCIDFFSGASRWRRNDIVPVAAHKRTSESLVSLAQLAQVGR